MLVIFPFEEPFYRERGIDAQFVGHPLAELPPPAISREQFAAENSLDPSRTWIGLLPGSRLTEIQDHLPTMLEAARSLVQAAGSAPHPSNATPGAPPTVDQFLIPLAPTLDAAQRATVAQLVEPYRAGLSVHLVLDARAALFHARASVVASGTATVEAALIGNPFVVVYRVSPVTYAIAKRVVKVPHVAMANLIAGKRVVPELIQHDFTASNIVQQLMQLLPDGPARESMKMELGVIRTALQGHAAGGGELTPGPPAEGPGRWGGRPGAIEQVAQAVVKEIQVKFPAAGAAAQP